MDLRLASINYRRLSSDSGVNFFLLSVPPSGYLFLFKNLTLTPTSVKVLCLRSTSPSQNDWTVVPEESPGRCLNARCTLLSNSASMLCILNVIIKNKAFRFTGVHWPNTPSKLRDVFQRVELFVTSSTQVVLEGDRNAVLDPNLDWEGTSRTTNNLDVRYFREFVTRLDLIHKFREREKHPSTVDWTWASRGVSSQFSSYLYRVLWEST